MANMGMRNQFSINRWVVFIPFVETLDIGSWGGLTLSITLHSLRNGYINHQESEILILSYESEVYIPWVPVDLSLDAGVLNSFLPAFFSFASQLLILPFKPSGTVRTFGVPIIQNLQIPHNDTSNPIKPVSARDMV